MLKPRAAEFPPINSCNILCLITPALHFTQTTKANRRRTTRTTKAMIRPQIQRRLAERCGSPSCQIYQRLFASAAKPTTPPPGSSSRPSKPTSSNAARSLSARKPAIERSSPSIVNINAQAKTKTKIGSTAPRAAGTAAAAASAPPGSPIPTIATSASPNAATAAGGSGSISAGMRTAEAREAALRAARLRRLAQTQDREAEAAKSADEKKAYQKKYKSAARKWVSTIIALPIFFVTSYYLFDRCEFAFFSPLTMSGPWGVY